MSDDPAPCDLCESAVHDAVCDRCARLVCFDCSVDGVCDECASEDLPPRQLTAALWYLADREPELGLEPLTCDKTLATCRDQFDNVANFGGWHAPPNMSAPCPFVLGSYECGADVVGVRLARVREVERAQAELRSWESKPSNPGGADCPVCYGTGYQFGIGAGCPRGCAKRS